MNVSGKKLKIALKEASLTQKIAADRLRISRQTLSAWLKNDEISEDILHKVKRVLDINLLPPEHVKKGDIIEYNRIVTDNINQQEIEKPGFVGDFSFNDVKSVNQHATYKTNSTFPEDSPKGELWQLIDNQQQQIRILMQQLNLVNNQIELMNKFLPKS